VIDKEIDGFLGAELEQFLDIIRRAAESRAAQQMRRRGIIPFRTRQRRQHTRIRRKGGADCYMEWPQRGTRKTKRRGTATKKLWTAYIPIIIPLFRNGENRSNLCFASRASFTLGETSPFCWHRGGRRLGHITLLPDCQSRTVLLLHLLFSLV